MKKPGPPQHIGRKRRAAGWTLFTVGVIVAGLWLANGWWRINGNFDAISVHHTLGVQWGGIAYDRSPHTVGVAWQNGWLAERTRPIAGWQWWYGWGVNSDASNVIRHYGVVRFRQLSPFAGPPIKGVDLLLWPIVLLLWIPAALLFRSGARARRRAMTNACTKCGYSRTGLAKDTPCPECGKAGAVTN